ncbi:oxidoreductase [Niastella yeongjuensis]|uniref:Oxidoreductase n=1 Tax=Niastella yeongjuensis TaxID=354355 RepID=A0A1V9F2I6_9BACT|nr:YCF48-related protein [Niastella yeongjuensis]OQP52549.1 oxidoreductase [Niastella yeongjuensis]SEP34542.1 Photosynthesis system II assembly factor YCF48 [Niastella yeongjuensis]
MTARLYIFLFLSTVLPFLSSAQTIEMLTSGQAVSIRGLCPVNDNVIWVSGSKGTVGRSLNGGKTWQWITVKGFEKTDFRDIEAFNANTALIMGIAEPAYILKTTDGGTSWKVVFTDSTKGMFLDAMDFYDSKHGIVVGDPIDSKFYIAKTTNGGNTWTKTPSIMQSNAAPGEGCFASSGSNIYYFRNKDFLFVSGGTISRVHDDAGGRSLPIIQGKESTGANSIAVRTDGPRVSNTFIIAGGDFINYKDTTLNCVLTHDGGHTWIHPATPPHGYRSSIIYITGKKLLSCGISGVDLSTDSGLTWRLLSENGFHVCRKAKKGKVVFLAGGNGKIAKLVL